MTMFSMEDGRGRVAEGSYFLTLPAPTTPRAVGGSSPRVDHPLSARRGILARIGVARPELYFKSLTMVEYLLAPSISPASLLDISMVLGSGMVTGCIPGRLAAPFRVARHWMVRIHFIHTWVMVASLSNTVPSKNKWLMGTVISPNNTTSW